MPRVCLDFLYAHVQTDTRLCRGVHTPLLRSHEACMHTLEAAQWCWRAPDRG